MFKLNGGNGAVVCDSCGTIIKQNISFQTYSNESTGYDLCDQCRTHLLEVDNFDKIKDIMEFNNPNEFYFLQIIQRKKDGNITQVGNNGYRTIKTYYIYSKEQLESKKEKIKELCLKNNARAYINVNRRNAEEVTLSAIQKYAQLVSEGNAYQGYRVYDSACGCTRARKYKPFWVVDVDSKDLVYLRTIMDLINECRGAYDNKIAHVIPTLHGYHLITIGFDTQQFSQKLALENMDQLDIQKDNPTLLYYATFKA